MDNSKQCPNIPSTKLATLRELLAQGEQQADNGAFADYSLDKKLRLIDEQPANLTEKNHVTYPGN